MIKNNGDDGSDGAVVPKIIKLPKFPTKFVFQFYGLSLFQHLIVKNHTMTSFSFTPYVPYLL